MQRLRLSCLLVVLAAVSGCATPVDPPEVTAPTAAACAKASVHIVLHFDSQRIWGTDLDRNAPVSIALQPGTHWTYRPGPPAVLVDQTGTTAHDGDIIYSACLDALRNVYVIGAEDLPNQAPGA